MIKLQTATENDVQRIVEIKILAFNNESRTFGSGTDGGPPGYNSIDKTLQGINDEIYYKIAKDDLIIGSLFLSEKSTDELELDDFVIEPLHQNKGYGKLVLNKIEELHPEISKWTLCTPSYSIKNQYIYESHGYIKVDVSKDGFLFFYEKIV